MELSKQDTKMIQGLSVAAMLMLHLFDRNHEGLYTPLLFIGGTALSFYIAQLCDFCVFGFAFCSGYGHMVQYEHCEKGTYRNRLKGLLKVYLDYWIILFLFSTVSLLIGNGRNMPGSAMNYLAAMAGLNNSYNGAWWYLYVYAVIVLISPWLLKALSKWHPVLLSLSGCVLYCSAYYFRFRYSADNWLLMKYGPLGMTIAEYMFGAFCCRLKIVSKMREIWRKIPDTIRCVAVVMILLTMLYVRTKLIPSLFVAPATGFILILLFCFWEKPVAIQRVFLYLGKHSTNIWLTHMFFISTLFPKLVYVMRWPVLILGFLMLIVILLSELLLMIERPIHKLVSNL